MPAWQRSMTGRFSLSLRWSSCAKKSKAGEAVRMPEIIHFIPRAELDAEANLRAFVHTCRTRLTVFGANLPFDENVWDVTDSYDPKARGRCRLVFKTWGKPKVRPQEIMPEP